MAASSSRKTARTPRSLKEIVGKLSSRSPNSLQSGLQQVQSLVRKSKALEIVREFRELGGLDEVVSVVKSCDDEKVSDLALSVLATCCREHQSKIRVHELDGISAIVEVLSVHSSVSIINRASRALANLAETPRLCAAIHRKNVVPHLVRYLRETTDSNCRQSILRTLRMLADTIPHTWGILQSGGLLVTLSCLDSEDVKLVGCAAHTAAEITNNLGSGHSTEALKSYREAGRQAVEDNGVSLLVGLLSHSKSSIQEHALMALLNLMVFEGVRVAAGKAGAVEIFIERGKATTFAGWATYIHCLCFCCQESVNRVRVRDLEGLQVLLNILKSSDEDCSRLHETVLVALMDFYYDEPSLNYLAACGFIPILVTQLRLEEMRSVSDTSSHTNPNSKCEESTDPVIIINKPSTSSSKDQDNRSVKRTLSGQQKRLQSQGGGVCKKLKVLPLSDQGHSSKYPATESTDLPTGSLFLSRAKQAQLLDPLLSQSPQDSSSATSSKVQVAQGMDNSSPSHSSSASGMSPSLHPSNYHSYVNPDATPYSPPTVDWEWFLQHREKMGQELSPRSYSSFSSPQSLSPPRYDFSPMSSPNWSPRWSPQHSPQYFSKWSSPQHGTEWSSQSIPTWSPQHSPQWERQSLPDPSTSASPTVEETDSAVADHPTLSTGRELPISNLPETEDVPQLINIETADVNSLDDTVTEASASGVTGGTPSDATSSLFSTNESMEIQKSSDEAKVLKEPLVPTVSGLSLSDHGECLMESQKPAKKVSQDQQCPSSSEGAKKTGTFREPHTKSLKMRTGKSKTTSVPRQTPKMSTLENLETDTDLFPIGGLSEPTDKGGTSKFEREMEIRRARTEGKLRRREYAVVTLLSRYSHMDDPSSNMARESVISVLLDYRPSSSYLQSKCQRTLHRILRNRLCFEQLLLEHVPMLIARKMLERERNAKAVHSSDRSRREGSRDEPTADRSDIKSLKGRSLSSDYRSTEDSPLSLISQKRVRVLRKWHSTSELAPQSPNKDFSGTDHQVRAQGSDADAVAEIVDDVASDTTSVCSMDTLESEQFQLWGDTASPLYPLMVSTCQYRQSLMLGLLMSDSSNGRMACVLAVPYICQSNSLKRKLLIKHKGLQFLLEYLQRGSVDSVVYEKAVQCLCDLSSLLLSHTTSAVSEGIQCCHSREHDCFRTDASSGNEDLEKDTASKTRSEEGKSASDLRTEDSDLSAAHHDDSSRKEGTSSGQFSSSFNQDTALVREQDPVRAGSISMAVEEAMDCPDSSGDAPSPHESHVEIDQESLQLHHPRASHLASQEGISSKKCTVCCFDAVEQQPDISFLLDKKTVIQTHKDTLVRSSEYFACLLEGPYLESEQSMVPIKEISQEALVVILHILYGCLKTRCCHMRAALTQGCKTVLEGIACSGRFLLWSVQNQLCDILVENYMVSFTVVSHFQFGLKHSCSKLTSACMIYMLTSGQVSASHFQELVERGCADAAFKTIERLMTDALFSIN